MMKEKYCVYVEKGSEHKEYTEESVDKALKKANKFVAKGYRVQAYPPSMRESLIEEGLIKG